MPGSSPGAPRTMTVWMSAVTGSHRADNSALEALVDAAAGILAADSLSDTLTRIAHHLAGLVDFDEISVYEVQDTMLVPVFALGAYADEVMADSFPVTDGVTGWVVTNRAPATSTAPTSTRWPRSSRARRRARVAGLRAAAGRRPRRGRAQRVPDRLGKEFGAAEVATVERFATMAALASTRAQRDTLREQARTDGLTACSTTAPATRRCTRSSPARSRTGCRSAWSCSTSTTQVDQRRLRPRRGRQGPQGGRRPLRASVRAGDTVARLGGEESR